MSKAFVYCWTDKKTNMLYVGSHKGNVNDGYVCSSKYMLEEYHKRPNDFSRQIIAEGNVADIRQLESAILQSTEAKTNVQFYNRHQNDGLFFDGWSKGQMSFEHRKKLADAKKGKKLSEDHKKKLLSSRIGKKNSEQHIAAVRAAHLGIPLSEEHRKKISASRKKRSDLKLLSSKAGKISSEKYKQDPERQKAHSERMKKWWADRKSVQPNKGD